MIKKIDYFIFVIITINIMLKVFQNFENELRNNYIRTNENNKIILEYHNNQIENVKSSIQICENIIKRLKNSIDNIENAIIDTITDETIINNQKSIILNEMNDDISTSVKIKLRPIISKLYKLGKERESLIQSYNHNYSILETKELELDGLKETYENLNKQIQKEIITNYYDNIIVKNDFERFLHSSFALLD